MGAGERWSRLSIPLQPLPGCFFVKAILTGSSNLERPSHPATYQQRERETERERERRSLQTGNWTVQQSCYQWRTTYAQSSNSTRVVLRVRVRP